MIIFDSKRQQDKLPIYRVKLQDHSFVIEFNGTTTSITSSNIRSHKQLLTDTITAFLRTNPTGFIELTNSMLQSIDNPQKGFSFSKDFITELERIADRLTYRLFNPSPISYPFDDFRSGIHFPLLYTPAYRSDWIDSYCPPATQYCVIELTYPDHLIYVQVHRDENRVLQYSPAPCAEGKENILDINTFMATMRQFVELDQQGFIKAFIKLKKHYDKMPPACNVHYYQLCLMATVYDHFYCDFNQAAHHCGLIDLD